MRRLLLVAALVLTGCVSVPTSEPAPPAKPAPAPDPIICADIEPAPALRGGIPQPTTPEAIDAVRDFFRGSAELWGWANRGWFRAKVAKDQFCQ